MQRATGFDRKFPGLWAAAALVAGLGSGLSAHSFVRAPPARAPETVAAHTVNSTEKPADRPIPGGSAPGAEGGKLTGNQTIANFQKAKKIAATLRTGRELTLYCRCRYAGKRIDFESCGYVPARESKRSRSMEWEHVVPAEAFGQSFVEWREGAPFCRTRKKKYKGRRCAEKNPDFARMEADLYNLFPEVGEVNGMRSNFSMAEVGVLGKFTGTSFGGCKAKISGSKFEPMEFAKGTVARVYLYMDGAYPGHGIISDKNRKLFDAWDRSHPVEPWECELYRKTKKVQGNENPVLATRCAGI